MISNDTELKQAKGTLENLELALADLKKTLADEDINLFELFAASYLKDIDSLRREIDDYIGVSLAQNQRADIWLKLKGPHIRFGETSVQIISNWINKLDSSFKTALFKKSGIAEAYDLQFAAVSDGSFGIGFKFPETQLEFFKDRGYYEEILEKLSLAAISLSSENPELELERNFPDPKERKIFLESAKNLVPSIQSKVESVEIYGGVVRKAKKGLKTSLIPELREKANSILKKLDEEVKEREEERVVLRGWLFKVNYSNNNFWLKGVKGKFQFESDIARKVKEALDYDKEHPQPTEVMGLRKRGVIRVLSIKRVEE